MTDDLHIRTRQHQSVAVAEFHGPLDAATPGWLSDALREHAAEQPAALVLDLTSTHGADDRAIDALRDATHTARRWSGVPMVVLSPNEPLDAALRRARLDAHAIVTKDRAAAFSAAEQFPAPPRHTLRSMPADPHVLRLVRRAVAEACESWDIEDTTEAAQLAASELVSNSIEHARTPSDLTLALRSDHLHIVVRDGSRILPQSPRDPGPADLRGRGLLLIDELTAAWASIRTATGKLVWAVLAVERTHPSARSAGATPAAVRRPAQSSTAADARLCKHG